MIQITLNFTTMALALKALSAVSSAVPDSEIVGHTMAVGANTTTKAISAVTKATTDPAAPVAAAEPAKAAKTPAKTTPKVVEQAAEPTVAYVQVKEAIGKLASSNAPHGRAAVIAILGEHGVKLGTELKESDWPVVLEKLAAKQAELDGGDAALA